MRETLAGEQQHNGLTSWAAIAPTHTGAQSRPCACRPLGAGVYGLHPLCRYALAQGAAHKAAFADWCKRSAGNAGSDTADLAMLTTAPRRPDAELPATGIGIERERLVPRCSS